LLTGKPVVSKRVFNQLLPELRARAFTVSGVASMDALQRIRDAVASVPLGGEAGQTWDQAKAQIVDELDPYLGDGADYRATLILRTNGFQAFSTSIHNVGMADEDTTHFQYLHGECKMPTPSHLALNGIVLPKDDPFWETHTGPWGHLGCMCYKRTMNEDQVADEKADDEKKNPDAQNVITGPALKQLHHGDIIRDGRHFNVDYDGPDNTGFKWSPGDFKIPLKDLEAKYDPETWSDFQTWARNQALTQNQSVWDWLTGVSALTYTDPIAAERPAAPGISSLLAHEARIRGLTTEEGLAWDRNGKLIGHGEGADRVNWSEEQVAKMEGGTLTHNHPSGLPPSMRDYYFAAKTGLAEMRVVTKDGVWVIRAPAAGWPGKDDVARAEWFRQLKPKLDERLSHYSVSDQPAALVDLIRHYTEASVQFE